MQRDGFIGKPVERLTYVCERPGTVTIPALSSIGGTQMTRNSSRKSPGLALFISGKKIQVLAYQSPLPVR
jgi:hypothetical protein